MSWKRARNSEQKAERISAILVAAGGLFDQKGFASISMKDIAETAGLGKASLYSYFKTKEEVFASLFLQESEAWFESLKSYLTGIENTDSSTLAKILTDNLRTQERFCRLTVILYSVVEKNLSKEFIYNFKFEVQANLKQYASKLNEVMPSLAIENGVLFLCQHQAVIAGLWPTTHPTPEIAEVTKSEEFNDLHIDFFELFQSTMEKLLRD